MNTINIQENLILKQKTINKLEEYLNKKERFKIIAENSSNKAYEDFIILLQKENSTPYQVSINSSN